MFSYNFMRHFDSLVLISKGIFGLTAFENLHLLLGTKQPCPSFDLPLNKAEDRDVLLQLYETYLLVTLTASSGTPSHWRLIQEEWSTTETHLCHSHHHCHHHHHHCGGQWFHCDKNQVARFPKRVCEWLLFNVIWIWR